MSSESGEMVSDRTESKIVQAATLFATLLREALQLALLFATL